MTDVDLSKLRERFKPKEIGKLPRVTCSACSKNECSQHRKSMCDGCGNYISERHIHLDYVGHADVTIRLLDVDPAWTWKPHATDPDPAMYKAALESGNPEVVQMVLDNAPPKFERDAHGRPVGLWIYLTVGGVTKPGYGSCPSNQRDAEKVLIGDAIRNAAMRHGVATELWAKGDRADPTMENAVGSPDRATPHSRAPQSAGEAFDNAGPQVSRPARRGRAPQVEADPEAQALADKAFKARSLPELEEIRDQADKARKTDAPVCNPATRNVGKLSVILEWQRRRLTETEAAAGELADAAGTAGISADQVEEEAVTVIGKTPGNANPAELRQVAAVIRQKAAAQAGAIA